MGFLMEGGILAFVARKVWAIPAKIPAQNTTVLLRTRVTLEIDIMCNSYLLGQDISDNERC